jgi:protein kinase/protein kinase A
MIQIYQVLKFLHSKNILYRDLKPENIMISDEGFIRLIDFGLSKQLKDENEKLNDICGTNEYIPPEVIKNENYSFNFDWWGFGILMFELLIGKVQ